MSCNRIFDRVSWVTLGFFLSYFFFNLARFQPQVSRVPGQSAGLGWFQNYAYNIFNLGII